ncbi:MAG: hypothetical protein IPM64_01330 [Phycisphaerales bacterium]|nr:hypothetical protein [Phycisphaerales bacterium]
MTERQFQRALENQRLRRRPRLVDSAFAPVLERAGRAARGWTAVQRAWSSACRPEWRERAAPATLVDGVLTIVTADAPTRHEISERLSHLARDFRSAGVSRIRVTIRSDFSPRPPADQRVRRDGPRDERVTDVE